MKYELLFIEIFSVATVTGHVMDTPWSWRFSSSTTVSSWWWRVVSFLLRCQSWKWGVVILSHVVRLYGAFWPIGYLLWRGRHPCTITPSHIFPAKFPFLNYMGSKIGLSWYWAYAIYFCALVQSTAPQAWGSKRQSGDSGKTWGDKCPLLCPICMA
jgi:hypothetical protein